MQTHLEPKIVHQNLAVKLRQFNYSKNRFILLVPEVLTADMRQISMESK